MTRPILLALGGIPDNNLAEVRSWSPAGVDLLFDGNVTIDALAKNPAIRLMPLMLGGSAPAQRIPLSQRPDVVFNLICNPESSRRALELADKLCGGLAAQGIRILNPPRLVKETSREKAASFFEGLDLVQFPQAQLLHSPSTRILAERLRTDRLRLPLIVRTAAEHNGDHMVLLRSDEDLPELDRLPFDGRDYYVIPFVDFCNADGLYRKYRMLKIGDTIVPRHRIVSRQWKVHSDQRAEDANFDADELSREHDFRADPKRFLGPALYQQLVQGLQNTGLDFVGVDFGFLDDGSAVVFECNACTNAGTRAASPDKSPQRASVIRRVEDAFLATVIDAARPAVPSG